MKPRFQCIHEHKHIQTGDGHRKLVRYSSTRMLLFCSPYCMKLLFCDSYVQIHSNSGQSSSPSLTQAAADLNPFWPHRPAHGLFFRVCKTKLKTKNRTKEKRTKIMVFGFSYGFHISKPCAIRIFRLKTEHHWVETEKLK